MVSVTTQNFVALCYHYVRPQSGDSFPRLLGTRADDFRAHVRLLKRSFSIMEPHQIRSDSRSASFDGRCNLLFTFDDGLSDHLTAGQILAEEGVRGLFFIPTCILADGQPANPIVIHYGIATYGIEKFLCAYRNALEESQLPVDQYDVPYLRGSTNPWATIRSIKQRTKYDLGYRKARSVLLCIYQELLFEKNPGIMLDMHIDAAGISKLIDMGHSIGSHSHTHLSVAASDLPNEAFEAEIIRPRRYLENCFGIRVDSMSYPFGGHDDCFNENELRPVESGYEFAFTVERKLNTATTSRFSLGRYMPVSTDSAESISNILFKIVEAAGTPI